MKQLLLSLALWNTAGLMTCLQVHIVVRIRRDAVRVT